MNHVDDATRGIAPEQGSLGTAQNLDIGEVERIDHGAVNIGQRNTVNDHSHRRIETAFHFLGADATHIDRRATGRYAHRVDHNVGYKPFHLADIAHYQGVDVIAAKRTHRDGYVLPGLHHLTRGDNHFFDLHVLGLNDGCAY